MRKRACTVSAALARIYLLRLKGTSCPYGHAGDAAGVTRASSQQDKAETEILELAAPSSPAAKTSQVAAPPKTPDNGNSGGATSTRGMIAQGVQMLKEVASPKPGPKAPIQVSLSHE